MTHTIEHTKTLLAAALAQHESAKMARPEDNPYAERNTLDMVRGAGIMMSHDRYPALPMTVKAAPLASQIKPVDTREPLDMEGAEAEWLRQWTDQAAFRVDSGRRAGLAAGKADTGAKRQAEGRARAARKAQFDAIAKSPVMPDGERLGKAWMVVLPMTDIIEKIAASKASWAARYLGSTVEDMPSTVIEAMVLVLAKSTEDLDVLVTAAEELGHASRSTGRIPGDQMTDDEKAERRKIAKGRKWLMGMVNNRVMGALVDAYTNQRNLKWDNIDLIATVMVSISGVGEDPLVNRHKADRAPGMLGTRFSRPGGLDAGLLSTVIAGALTDRHLDRLVELLLDEENRQTNGAFMWQENAERVFRAVEDGDMKWDLVASATANHKNPANARGNAARIMVQSEFEFLPGLIVEAVEAFDPQMVSHRTYADGTQKAVLRSGFDSFVTEGARFLLAPTLRYATVEQAAAAIAENLAIFTTGDEVAKSVAYA